MRSPLLFASTFLCTITIAQSVTLTTVASGFTDPLDVDNAGDKRLFVTQRNGIVKVIDPYGNVLSLPFLDITDRVNSTAGEQGLLGLTFHPQYATNGYFYVNYVHGSGSGTTRISRFSVTADPNIADPNSELIIWSTPQPSTNHNGGDLRFGPDGYLYFALGDGGGVGDPNNLSQNLLSPHGKMIRIDVNNGSPYSIPPTNPFVGNGSALPEIWARGFRNPFRFSFDALTGDLWIGDVGQDVYEEIDLWPAGNNSGPNFGWRCYEGTAPYNTTGCASASSYVQPIFQHHHDDGSCSVIGGFVYRGNPASSLYGKYVYTDFCHGRFSALWPNGSGGWNYQQLSTTEVFGFASMGVDVNGELLVANTITGVIQRLNAPASPHVLLEAKVFLQGPFNSSTALMTDALRIANSIPTIEPYSGMGFSQLAGGGGESTHSSTFSITGANAIVDWVRLELRNSSNLSQVVATRQALLQRDGDIVSATGTPAISFGVAPGSYHVVVTHRNHLPVMTASPIALSTMAATLDLRTSATSTYGTSARATVGSWRALWAGDVSGDGVIKYTGQDNDRDQILLAIGGVSPTAIITGYYLSDTNMDNVVRYTGNNNDRDLVLLNIGGVIPTQTRQEQVP
jgi:glucose/arabinose dehydrogenase